METKAEFEIQLKELGTQVEWRVIETATKRIVGRFRSGTEARAELARRLPARNRETGWFGQ